MNAAYSVRAVLISLQYKRVELSDFCVNFTAAFM